VELCRMSMTRRSNESPAVVKGNAWRTVHPWLWVDAVLGRLAGLLLMVILLPLSHQDCEYYEVHPPAATLLLTSCFGCSERHP
jgi:hypothetical protein